MKQCPYCKEVIKWKKYHIPFCEKNPVVIEWLEDMYKRIREI